MFLPPRLDGALYLVEPEILLRAPDRDDFVTPATYGVEFDDSDGGGQLRTYLVAVHRTMAPITGDLPNINIDAI